MSLTPTTRIDGHVHIVGNGKNGSGCRLNLTWPGKIAGRIMASHNGIPFDIQHPEFDRAYVEHLVQLVRSSSLGAAVILAHDHVYDGNGAPLESAGTFYVPNDYVLSLAEQFSEFLPACSIHPARADALDELERCIEAGAVMLKLLPSGQNINCNDSHYTRFWERLAKAKLPLLAHTGHEFSIRVINKKFADPGTLTLPLECGVNVIAAHCATEKGFFGQDYIPVFIIPKPF